MDWLDDDMVSKNKTPTIDYTEDDMPDDEVDEIDFQLAEFNILSDVRPRFEKRYPDKKVVYRGQPTQDFFQYYLDNCDGDRLNLLLERAGKLSKALRQMLDDAKPVSIGARDEGSVGDYIEKNALLMEQNHKLEERCNSLRKQLAEVMDSGNATFLYELMSNKMEFIEGADITDEEIEKVSTIKEMLGL